MKHTRKARKERDRSVIVIKIDVPNYCIDLVKKVVAEQTKPKK